MNKRLYTVLLVVTIAATVGGVLTLIPWPQASYPNILGYRSLCTFAPAATLYCFAIAGVSCVFRASLVKRKAYAGKPVVKALPIVVVTLLFATAIASTIWFGLVKSQYFDGSSGPTVTVTDDR